MPLFLNPDAVAVVTELDDFCEVIHKHQVAEGKLRSPSSLATGLAEPTPKPPNSHTGREGLPFSQVGFSSPPRKVL